ncbi:hypothetical protein MRX96_053560 [Rhipicephalus microplus]
MFCERTETSKQALRQESSGGERVTSPPKRHRPRSRKRRSQSKSRGKSHDRALESLNNTPGTESKSSTTTLGLIPPKEQSRECGETRISTSKEASSRWTDASLLRRVGEAGPSSLKSSLPNSSHPPSSHNYPNVPLTSNAHNCTKQELQDALTKLRDSLKAKVTA